MMKPEPNPKSVRLHATKHFDSFRATDVINRKLVVMSVVAPKYHKPIAKFHIGALIKSRAK